MVRILAVKIKRAINENRVDLYEATRGNWKAAKENCNTDTVGYVVGIYEGKVLSAYRPTRWYSVIEDGTDSVRRRFEGTPVDKDLFEIFKKNEEKIINSFGHGAAISYVEMDLKNYNLV
ncbi:hypothetical protein V7139_22150 [Neobacillus drentensis]|uniref:hypothetical protein n=1 Tax=Neobacillus drentensis TaxID=220684 RepID=UPI003002751E